MSQRVQSHLLLNYFLTLPKPLLFIPFAPNLVCKLLPSHCENGGNGLLHGSASLQSCPQAITIFLKQGSVTVTALLKPLLWLLITWTKARLLHVGYQDFSFPGLDLTPHLIFLFVCFLLHPALYWSRLESHTVSPDNPAPSPLYMLSWATPRLACPPPKISPDAVLHSLQNHSTQPSHSGGSSPSLPSYRYLIHFLSAHSSPCSTSPE